MGTDTCPLPVLVWVALASGTVSSMVRSGPDGKEDWPGAQRQSSELGLEPSEASCAAEKEQTRALGI